MWATVIAAFLVLAVFLVLWIVFFKKRQEKTGDQSDITTYTCNECSEKHCNCYKEDEQSSDL
ncbi:MAG: hypothetical protein BWK80_23510 [Desulfobacteraceae bacterium IS3]|nr:MAG: hypothetical protein BWK80_23510 [Desulfobacteraceae bacterium IS3]